MTHIILKLSEVLLPDKNAEDLRLLGDAYLTGLIVDEVKRLKREEDKLRQRVKQLNGSNEALKQLRLV